jgi:hypothetical protein
LFNHHAIDRSVGGRAVVVVETVEVMVAVAGGDGSERPVLVAAGADGHVAERAAGGPVAVAGLAGWFTL